jgi:hypothetical protein
MNNAPILTGLLLGAAVLFFIWLKFKNKRPVVDTGPKRPADKNLPPHLIENDKLIIVKQTSYDNINNILAGFCNMYNKATFQAAPRLTEISASTFFISFPYDIDFDIFCYCINYIQYPIEGNAPADICAWATIKEGDQWAIAGIINKKVMLFIPADDTEHDNVYMTTADNTSYKLSFSKTDKAQRLDTPEKRFGVAEVAGADISGKAYTDFK